MDARSFCLVPFGEPWTLAVACAAITLVLVGLILLGFGPLRHWLGLTEPSSPRSPREHWEGGLLATWRLSRALAQPLPARQAPARPSYPVASYDLNE